MKVFIITWLLIITSMSGSSCSRSNDVVIRANAPATEEKPATNKDAGLMSGYLLDTPDQIDTLPNILDEVSGLTDISSAAVAMVQDEIGVIFLYDINTRKIIKRVIFAPPGDYEGITRVNDTIFVLESKGILYEVRDWLRNANVVRHKLSLSTADHEGLCFDPIENRILLAPKSRWKEDNERNSLRPIFAVDIETGELFPEPVFTLDTNNIINFALNHNLDIPREISKKGKERIRLRFKPASLAIHPVTHDIFVISAVDQVLASFNRKGDVTGVQFLNRKMFPKPEGITFLPDSSLVITNEAVHDKPTLQVFKWHPDAE